MLTAQQKKNTDEFNTPLVSSDLKSLFYLFSLEAR